MFWVLECNSVHISVLPSDCPGFRIFLQTQAATSHGKLWWLCLLLEIPHLSLSLPWILTLSTHNRFSLYHNLKCTFYPVHIFRRVCVFVASRNTSILLYISLRSFISALTASVRQVMRNLSQSLSLKPPRFFPSPCKWRRKSLVRRKLWAWFRILLFEK